jgi:hypothetical protein
MENVTTQRPPRGGLWVSEKVLAMFFSGIYNKKQEEMPLW